MHNPFSPTRDTCPTSINLRNLITGTLQKFCLALRLNRKSTPPSHFRLKSTHVYLSDTSFADNAALLNKKKWTFLFWKVCHSAGFTGTAGLYGWIRRIFIKFPHFLPQDTFSLSFRHHKQAWTKSYLPTVFLWLRTTNEIPTLLPYSVNIGTWCAGFCNRSTTRLAVRDIGPSPFFGLINDCSHFYYVFTGK